MTIELGRGSASSAAPAGAYFEAWTDHDSWSSWSPDTEWVRLDGPVQQGTSGKIKPRGGPAVRFVISACRPDEEYTDTSRLPGARLVFQHTAEATEVGTRLAVLVTISGPLAPLWGRVLGRGFETSAQADLDRLVAIVEQRTATR